MRTISQILSALAFLFFHIPNSLAKPPSSEGWHLYKLSSPSHEKQVTNKASQEILRALRARLDALEVKKARIYAPKAGQIQVCIHSSQVAPTPPPTASSSTLWQKLWGTKPSFKPTPTLQAIKILLTKKAKIRFFSVEDDAPERIKIYKQMKASMPSIFKAESASYNRPQGALPAKDLFFTSTNLPKLLKWIAIWNKRLDKQTPSKYHLMHQSYMIEDKAPRTWRTILLYGPAFLENKHIDEAKVRIEPQWDIVMIQLSFNKQGKDIFTHFTSKHVGHRIAIAIDQHVESAPIIQTTIKGGMVQITLGAMTPKKGLQYAKSLVFLMTLSSNPRFQIPFPLQLTQKSFLSPKDGQKHCGPL